MDNKNAKKVLFIPSGIGLAHLGRLIVVAKELQKRGNSVVFGASKESSQILKKEKLSFRILPELTRQSLEDIKKLRLNLYSTKNIEDFVKSEITLIRAEKPDLVVSDTRPTAKISSKITSVPLVTINNANLSTFYDYSNASFPLPTFFLSEFLPVRVISQFEKKWMQKNVLSKVGPTLIEAFFIKQLLKFNIVLRKFRQAPIKSLYSLFRGDLTLICDAPFFRPMKTLPKDVIMTGPLFWQPSINPPIWARNLESKIREGHKIIYVTAAGTGDKYIFKKVLETVCDFPAIIVATGGNAVNIKDLKLPKKDNLFLTDFLPGDWIMKNARAVIFFGGNSTAYQALSNGTPQITLPLHLDQQDNANQLSRLGTTIILNPFKVSKETLLPALSEILFNPKYKNTCLKCKKELENWPGVANAANEVEKFMQKGKRIPKSKNPLTKIFERVFLKKSLNP